MKDLKDFGGSLMSSFFQSLTENEVVNGCCVFNVEDRMLCGLGSVHGASMCSEGPSQVHTDTPGHLSACAARGNLALETGSICLHGSSGVPCSAGIRSLCLSKAAGCPQLLLLTAVPTCCSLLLSMRTAQARGLISAFSDSCHHLLFQRC